ncbi:MAG: amidase [Nitriliruptoraceae bacterium]
MAAMDELAYAGVRELAERIRSRELSPVELMDAVVARIEARNPSLNALVYTAFDEAREEAKRAEADVAEGSPLGALHGIPVAMKDLFDFKPGWPSTLGGIRALKDFSMDARCVFVERVEAAGAIVVGKTNSPVMGFRGTCDNPLFGATRNPFDLERNPGGSSGGSAAAVADGLLPMAEGTDGGGSIRIPAAWCSLYGYQPSFGRVASVVRPNAWGNTMPFLYEGALTRSVEDAALTLNVLSGSDRRDPFSWDDDTDLTTVLHRPLTGKRIAYSPDLGVYPVDRRVAGAVAGAVEAFEEAGAHVEQIDIDLPYTAVELAELWSRHIMLVNVGALENFKANGLDLMRDHPDDFPPKYRMWVETARRQTVPELLADYNLRTEVYDAIAGVFEQYDLLVAPTLATLPVRNAPVAGETVGPTEIEGVAVEELIGWCLTFFTNFSGHPAANVPAGLVEGLPVGMQIIGDRYGDADVLAASAAFERIRPWHHHYERCAGRPLTAGV